MALAFCLKKIRFLLSKVLPRNFIKNTDIKGDFEVMVADSEMENVKISVPESDKSKETMFNEGKENPKLNKEKKNKKDKKKKQSDNKEIRSENENENTDAGKKLYNCYMNRELSWLSFNERVLNEAGNSRVPIAERLSFASIFQTNLDEFFMVRVGTLMVQMHSDETICDTKTNMTSKEQVLAILKRVEVLEEKKARIYEQLMGELEPKGIRIINFNKLSSDEGQILETYFDHQIAPFLSPLIVGKQQPFPFLNNKELYALVVLEAKNGKGKNKIGIVQCNNTVFKRLIEIPTRPGCFMLSEELILHFVSKLYQKYTVKEKSIIRLTRNADIDTTDVYDEDMDYRDIMEQLIKKRKRMSPVRLEISRSINKKVLKEICGYIDMDIKHIVAVKTPLDLSYVFDLQRYMYDMPNTCEEWFYKKRTPQNSAYIDQKEKVIDQVTKKDILLSYPYEGIRPFIRMLHEAAEDESVVSIKMTLYRVADKSKVIEALIEAAENGKEVVVLVELRARFDEENNIENSRRLEEAGCKIVYGLGDYKVHSKVCLITRQINNQIQYITQIGTGNYNEKTSRLYTDLSLITANQEIGWEASELFRRLMAGEVCEETKHLLIAPKCLQNKIIELIDKEIENANNNKPAYIGVKINSLTDKVLIDKFIEASQNGVKVDLIVRGICCLVPKVPGLTDNVTVVSVVGRFLEHSRIYRFGFGDDEKVFIGSADFMTRNTVRRVEVATPIYDRDIKNRVRDIFDIAMKDDEKGKELICDGTYVNRSFGDNKMNSQEYLYDRAYEMGENKC